MVNSLRFSQFIIRPLIAKIYFWRFADWGFAQHLDRQTLELKLRLEFELHFCVHNETRPYGAAVLDTYQVGRRMEHKRKN